MERRVGFVACRRRSQCRDESGRHFHRPGLALSCVCEEDFQCKDRTEFCIVGRPICLRERRIWSATRAVVNSTRKWIVREGAVEKRADFRLKILFKERWDLPSDQWSSATDHISADGVLQDEGLPEAPPTHEVLADP